LTGRLVNPADLRRRGYAVERHDRFWHAADLMRTVPDVRSSPSTRLAPDASARSESGRFRWKRPKYSRAAKCQNASEAFDQVELAP